MAGLRTRERVRQPAGSGARGDVDSTLLHMASGVWALRAGAVNLITGEPAVLTGSASWNQSTRGQVGRTVAGANRVQLAADANTVVATSGGFTIALHYRKTDATNRVSGGFGCDASAIATQRAGAHFPYSDGTVYWDFGGNTAGTSRLTVGGLTFGDDFWVFTSGSRGMEIWQNGILRASQGSAASWVATTNPYMLGMHGTATDADNAESALVVTLKRQWQPEEIRAWFTNPWRVLMRNRRMLLGPPAGTGTDLVIAEALHAHAADNLTLTQQHALTVADAAHAHAADNLTLTQAHTLAIAEALHAHAADNVVLSVAGTLAVNDALHAHAADNLVLTQAHNLVLADALHGHTADNLALTQAHILAIQEALHAHTADNLTLAIGGTTLAIAEALHAHAADNLALTQLHILVISDTLHAHLADTLTLALPGATILHDRVLFIRGETRTLALVAQTRNLTVH